MPTKLPHTSILSKYRKVRIVRRPTGNANPDALTGLTYYPSKLMTLLFNWEI